jgi:hypothetical protein
MDLTKLNAFSTDTLQKMQKGIADLLESRLDTDIRHGRIVTFEHPAGVIHTARIERINQKTVGCVEISPTAGRKWRVGRTGLKVVPEVRKNPKMPESLKPKVEHTPASCDEDFW